MSAGRHFALGAVCAVVLLAGCAWDEGGDDGVTGDDGTDPETEVAGPLVVLEETSGRLEALLTGQIVVIDGDAGPCVMVDTSGPDDPERLVLPVFEAGAVFDPIARTIETPEGFVLRHGVRFVSGGGGYSGGGWFEAYVESEIRPESLTDAALDCAPWVEFILIQGVESVEG